MFDIMRYQKRELLCVLFNRGGFRIWRMVRRFVKVVRAMQWWNAEVADSIPKVDDWDARLQILVAYCQTQIAFYGRASHVNYRKYRGFLATTILAGTAGTIMAAFPVPEHLRYLFAIPSAIAALAAGVNGSFNYQRDAVRQALTVQALRIELASVRSRSGPYGRASDEQDVLNTFNTRVTKLISAEVGSWQSQTETADAKAKADESTHPSEPLPSKAP